MVAQQSANGIRQRARRHLTLEILEGSQGVFSQGLGFPPGLFRHGSAHGGIDSDDNPFDRPACVADAAGRGFGQLTQPGGVRGAGNHDGDLWSILFGDPGLTCQRRRERAGQHGLNGQQFAHGPHHVRTLGVALQPFQGRSAG